MSIAPLVVALVVAAVVASVGALAIAMILPSPRSTDEKLVIVAHGLFVLSFVLGALRQRNHGSGGSARAAFLR